MKISVYSVEKSADRNLDTVAKEYIKMASKYATLKDEPLFNKGIAKAQSKGSKDAKHSYTQAFEPYMKDFYNVSLDANGELVDSFEFAKILEKESQINFFIGGAFGLEKVFLDKTQRTISLSRLTYAHKIVKVILFEQIYRGLCINNNHPYHK